MNVITVDLALPDKLKYMSSIFLAGPTPREVKVPSWRPEAVSILEEIGYEGFVLVPERKNWKCSNYELQCEWEHEALANCKVLAIWVPRSIPDMPAFTTNIEFGMYMHDPKMFYGRPDGAIHCRYLDWAYMKYHDDEPYDNLEKLMERCVEEAV